MTPKRGKVHVIYKEQVMASNVIAYLKQFFSIVYREPIDATEFAPNFYGIWGTVDKYCHFTDRSNICVFAGKFDKVKLLPFTIVLPIGRIIFNYNEEELQGITQQIMDLNIKREECYTFKRQFSPFSIVKK